MRVRNISPHPRSIPCLGIEVDVDEAFDVPAHLAHQEWEIPGVFEVISTIKESE
jgi:hypothetical protein